MATLVRAKDWSRTPLGPIERWPRSLCTLVDMLLVHPLPMILLWGPELIQIYNDGYRVIAAGKHPAALGMATRECWPEVWHINGPIYERVLGGGERVSLEDALFPLARNTPAVEDVYINVAYGPAHDDAGRIAGVFITVTETTAKVHSEVARERLELEREGLLATLENERSRLAAIIEQAPAFICTLRGPEHVFELANDRYYDLVGNRDILGKPVREALPEVEAQGFVGLLDRVYRTGETFTGSELPVRLQRTGGDSLDQRYLSFIYQALRETDGSVAGIFVHGMDVTDLIVAREALRNSETRFRLIADAMPQIVWVTRPDGYHEYYNRRWYEYIGLDFEQSKGDQWANPLHPDDQDRARRRWERSLRTGEPYEIEYRFRRHDGEYRWFLARALPVRDPEGTIVKWYGTCTDIHDQKEWMKQREYLLEFERTARAEAERAGRLKDEFLATLSHELRTPLNAILGWSHILASSRMSDPEAVRKGIDVIARNAQAQAQLIEDLLDMSRIVSGQLRLEVQRVNLPDIIDAAIGTVQHAADTKQIRLTRDVAPDCGPLSGDPGRLQQVFWNLLSNAIKFTPQGGEVRVAARRAGPHLGIEVTDTGRGIGPEFLPYVFDRFRQADASITRQHGGLGLGLSIVKNLVELHGGTVRAESPGEGRGATFVVSLPVSSPASDTEPSAAPPPAR